MGLFLMLSGVANIDESRVEDALRDFATQRSGVMTPLANNANGDEDELLLIAESGQGNVTVLYPHTFTAWNEASPFLSATLKTPVFSLHVHDSDLWMYILFANGEAVDHFNTVPDYWDELSDNELEFWSGDASIIGRYWPNVHEEQIANYLQSWEFAEREGNTRAYPEDEFEVGDEWQITDFMAKVGLVYPMDGQDGQSAASYSFKIKDQ